MTDRVPFPEICMSLLWPEDRCSHLTGCTVSVLWISASTHFYVQVCGFGPKRQHSTEVKEVDSKTLTSCVTLNKFPNLSVPQGHQL